MPKVVIQGKQFSMRPIDPAVGINPTVRVLNMVLGADGTVQKRRDFDSASGASGQVLNHIVVELNSTSYLIVKTASAIQASSGGGFTTLSAGGTDVPIGSGTPKATGRGSFSLHGGEMYYCDEDTLFAWDGVDFAGIRRPGVVSLNGRVYNDTFGDGGFGHGVPDDDCYEGPPVIDFSCDADGPNDAPGVGCGNLPIDPCLELFAGEKSLNTGFAFSFYDPVRRIYGRRSEVFALPYAFGTTEPPPTTQAILLSPYRMQHAKRLNTPDDTDGSADYTKGHDYQVAIWFTRGLRPVSNQTVFTDISPWWVVGFWAPAMSKRMSQLLFLEGLFPLGEQILADKDDSYLFSSGRYLDVYNRPVPSKFLMILPNGVGIYFFPQIPEEIAKGDTEQIQHDAAFRGSFAEYSVGHPEQIGRHTDTQRDTISQLPNLKGDPQVVISDGINQLLLTKHAIYRVGFEGGVILSEVSGGRGVRALSSIQSSSVGVLWMADEGIVWLRGNSMILLDEQLGFSAWFRDLPSGDKEDVVIGAADSVSQILAFALDFDNGGQRAMAFDHERDFVSEFKSIGVTVDYAAHFRADGNVGAKLRVFASGGSARQYPGEAVGSYASSIEWWLTGSIEERGVVKRLQFVTIDLGNVFAGVDGDSAADGVTITVEAHDHPDTGKPFTASETRSVTITQDDGSGRHVRSNFIDMRGRLFKFTLAGSTNAVNWAIDRLEVSYDLDKKTDARSE